MASKTYMGIDPRRDHSFRVPRPTPTAPNACNGCHRDKDTQWASAALVTWYGVHPKQASNFATAFSAAKGAALDAEQRLLGVIEDEEQPAIVRGTALALLPGLASSRAVEPTRNATANTEPLVRYGAARALCGSAPPIATELGAPLLKDPVRLVRVTAAECLAKYAERLATPSQSDALGQALQEYRDVMRFNADQAQSLVNLANLATWNGDLSRAKSILEEALEREPGFVPASVNLADVVRKGGDETRASEILQAGLARSPNHPDLHLALGLSLARSGAQAEALKALQLAYEHSNERADTGYVLGMALDAMDQPRRALEVLAETQRRYPADQSVLLALVSLYAKQGRRDMAQRYAKKLTQVAPETAQRTRKLLEEP